MSIKNISLAVLGIGIFAAFSAQAQVMSSGGSYDSCIAASNGSDIKMIDCTNQETERYVKAIESKYETLASNEYFKAWNQGSGMFSGNFKTLFTQWSQYREKYCSLYGYSISTGGTLRDLSMAECQLELAKRQNKDLEVILNNYKRND